MLLRIAQLFWRLRRAADTSTNRRQDFLCRRTASMEQAADTAEATAVDHYFSSSTENNSVPVCLWTPGYRLVIAPSASVSQGNVCHTP